METGTTGGVGVRACASGDGSQAAGWGCEVAPGVSSPFISPPLAFTVYGTEGQFRNILETWLVEGGISIKGTMGVSQELLWERTNPSRVR